MQVNQPVLAPRQWIAAYVVGVVLWAFSSPSSALLAASSPWFASTVSSVLSLVPFLIGLRLHARVLTAVGLLIALVTIIVWVPTFFRTRASHDFSKCSSNLYTIARAVHCFIKEKHMPPHNIQQLVPLCLPDLPVCPVTNTTTYQLHIAGNSMTIFCSGDSHRNCGASNLPEYVEEIDTSRP